MKMKKKVLKTTEDQFKKIDPQRAIFVHGEINDDLVSTLAPQILALRINSKNPITVFIDSSGGDVSAFGRINGLLNTPDQMGRTCWINTVATGRACSAAADLLTSGDYIICYPNSYIHFHGIRTNEEEITAERAAYLREKMVSINRSTATNLAMTMFNRMFRNYEVVKDQMPFLREASGKTLKQFDILKGDGTIDVPAFIFYLIDKVKEPYKNLLVDCIHTTTQMSTIVNKLSRIAKTRQGIAPIFRPLLKSVEDIDSGLTLKDEINLLNVLLASKVKENPGLRLTNQNLVELAQDFQQLSAMSCSQDEVVEWVIRLSDLFLSKKDMEFFMKHTYEDTEDPKIRKQCDEIIDRAYEKIDALWSFSITLCRELTSGEHPISPEDAWWLGLIDEVLGSPTLTRRMIQDDVKARLIKKVSVRDFDRFVDYEKLFQ